MAMGNSKGIVISYYLKQSATKLPIWKKAQRLGFITVDFIIEIPVGIKELEMEKQWKKIIIDNKETFYSVSNFGEVRNDSTKTLLQGSIGNNGYRMVHLRQRINKNCSVHRLVMKAFCPCEEMDELQINHKDGNKLNNRLDNLEWTTALENMRHSYETGLQRYKMRECHMYNLAGNYIKSFINSREAEKETGIDNSNILRCMSGQQTHCKQYQFRDYKKTKIEEWKNWKENTVFVYDDNGEYVNTYSSQKECAKAFGVSESSISRYIKGTRKLKGFVFSKIPL